MLLPNLHAFIVRGACVLGWLIVEGWDLGPLSREVSFLVQEVRVEKLALNLRFHKLTKSFYLIDELNSRPLIQDFNIENI